MASYAPGLKERTLLEYMLSFILTELVKPCCFSDPPAYEETCPTGVEAIAGANWREVVTTAEKVVGRLGCLGVDRGMVAVVCREVV
eukprot:SAG31_NODE_8122_length_1518_cov_1.712474_1_plen_86_part_00